MAPDGLYVRHHMKLVLARTAITVLSGGAAFVLAALIGIFSIFATPFVAGFPAADPPDSTDYGRGMLMVFVGFCVFTALLVSLWIVCFRYLRRKYESDSIAGTGNVRSARDA